MRFMLPLLAILLALAGCSTGPDAVASGTEFQFVSPDGKTEIFYEGADRKPIGELSGDDLLAQGRRIALSDFAGQVVVLNIWGSWCGPCRVEAPELQELYEANRDAGVTVLGIDVRDEQRTAPQDFVRDRGITYPSIYDPPGRSLLALKGYPRSVVPSTIVLDRAHRVAAVYLHDLLATDLEPLVDRLTAER
ncbi:MAG TPA: TlpA disulfide reductase family protein [Actinophytocola sp.]|uniref:TlpA family protein disulfide reductase n=1 Tax=Actinophytocola sp. TaxID=1872138 RepID=UPI002DB5A8AB|nr:TlpA disulfide reductase family protein [Actinophytocola sp.]HEU5472011.1 TlpA disulfide reductase family protein [Actinophytocola sp.]